MLNCLVASLVTSEPKAGGHPHPLQKLDADLQCLGWVSLEALGSVIVLILFAVTMTRDGHYPLCKAPILRDSHHYFV